VARRNHRGARWCLIGLLSVSLASCASGRGSPAAPATTTTETDAGGAPPTSEAVFPATTTTTAVARNAPATLPPIPPGSWAASPWQPAGRTVAGMGGPAVETAALRVGATTLAVGLARLDMTRVRLALYAGAGQPAGSWSNQGAVGPSLWPGLIATFNSGFKLDASRGGWYLDGRAATPLRDGAASVVMFRSGSATVGQWGRDATLTGDVVAVRQNLSLLVDAGQPAPGLGTNILPAWGFTLGGAVATWRSALGVDGAGRLLYIAGPGLDPANLASAAIAAGAIRAMELDINPAFVLFSTFADGPIGPGGPIGTKLLPAMVPPATRFLTPVARDFFAVLAR
jgi:hypothetical protein